MQYNGFFTIANSVYQRYDHIKVVIADSITAANSITIDANKYITIEPEISNLAITKSPSQGSLFIIPRDASLTINGTETKYLAFNGIDTGTGNNSAVFTVQYGTLTMHNGIIQNDNSSDAYGGGGVAIYYDGYFEIINGTIQNTKASYGGGVIIREAEGTFIMHDGIITECTAITSDGGGVYNNGTFNLLGGEITGNSISNLYQGSGVYNASGSTYNNPPNESAIVYGNLPSGSDQVVGP
jgi:hypothetical protein